MLLECNATFNLQEDVVPWILQQSAPDNLERISKTIQILNLERNGRIIFTWKEAEDFTGIGLYDLTAPQCELLYSFDRDLHIISCSVNNEKTLLALSYCNPSGTPRYERLTPVSRYLALLIEIQPINNVRVLKAVDSSIQVQFLYPIGDEQLFPESHLLVVSEEKYIDHFHVRVAIEDDNRVVIDHSGQLPRDRVAEDFVWAQWDMSEQSLFYITPKHSSCVLHCVQFYPSENFKHILEVPLDVELVYHGVSLVNLGCDLSVDRDQTGAPAPNLQVFTNPTGGLCLLYVQPFTVAQEVSYMVEFIHKGYCKTFKVSTTAKDFSQLKVSFIDLDGYVAVYLPNYFLHLIDTSHPDLTCCHFFLEGDDARIRGLCSDYCIGSTSKASVIQHHTGILYSVQIHHLLLLKVLWSSREDSQRLAALHCALLHMDQPSHWDTQIIEWICENLSTCHSFDPMQEFIVAYLYRKLSLDIYYLDKILPYTSVPFWNEVIEGVSCSIDIIDMPILKMGTFKGFWEKFHSELEYMKHTQQRFLYNNHVPRKNWYKLISEVDTEKRNLIYQRSVLENAKKVILNMDRRKSDEKCVPLYQEEDFLQKDLMGLVMLKLKDHLSLHLPHVGKNKIDKIVLDYVSKQMDLICLILEVVWKKYNIERGAFCFTGKGTPPEYFAFHVMCRISEVTSKLCMLLPPGFHTLHLVLGVRCLPLANLLHFIDSGVLQLTETFVVKLLKELDDSENNEKLKCSIILRLPETICSKFHHLWDHAISNNLIAMNYVKRSLTKFKKREQLTRQTVTDPSSLYIDFLPLNYLIKMLSEVEAQALNPFEEDNIDAAYLEEIALKQTTQLLGFQRK